MRTRPFDRLHAATTELPFGAAGAAPIPVTPTPRAPRKKKGASALDQLSPLINRELSLLEFNHRVLQHGRRPSTPLLERLRFLTICSANLDEFYEIRVAGIRQQVAHELPEEGPDGLSPHEVLRRISARAHAIVAEQYGMLNGELLPALEQEGIRVLKRGSWTPAQAEWIGEFFQEEVHPIVTPMGLDPAHPFPQVQNKSLNFVVNLDGHDAFGRDTGIAVVKVPRGLARLIPLPPELRGAPHEFVLLSSIVHAHIGALFPEMRVVGCHQFRVTRDSDLWVHEEEVDDLLSALKGELPGRNFGDAVRLEVAEDCTPQIRRFLLGHFGLQPDDLFAVNGPVNLVRFSALVDQVDRPDLKYPAFRPRTPRRLQQAKDLFSAIRDADVLLHHPYESFAPVVELIRQASTDPDVLAIKQTLYRTGADSPIVAALIEAARAMKEVTVIVELRARFDEAANIGLAQRLLEAGANVVYGLVRYKTHAKALLIVRREGKQLRRYVHLGTGNYHDRTSKAYTDFGYLTCDPLIGEDVHQLFLQMTGLGTVRKLQRLLGAPFTLQDRLLQLIEAEAQEAQAGRPAHIVAKMNALSDPTIIRALYAASRAGVRIDLLVRGVCCLRPGVPGQSVNIRVRSVIGRFLEHHRVYRFHAAGKGEIILASADWMERNFYRRVEIGFPLLDEGLRKRVIEEAFDLYWADDVQSWELQPDGTWTQVARGTGTGKAAQEVLLRRIAGS
jgi:polyphosphate kinase